MSEAFQEQLKKYEMIPSLSRKGCLYDHACIESFHAILKKEEVYQTQYESFETAESLNFSI